MSRWIRLVGQDRSAPSTITFVAIVVGTFSLGLITARQTVARGDGAKPVGNREVSDSKKYGGFDDSFIYEQFNKPASDRNIPEMQLLRDDAVKVRKEYAGLPGNVPY
jgi:hypothetical protein